MRDIRDILEEQKAFKELQEAKRDIKEDFSKSKKRFLEETSPEKMRDIEARIKNYGWCIAVIIAGCMVFYGVFFAD